MPPRCCTTQWKSAIWHCDPKISIWAFYNGSLWDQLLGCLTVVARMWLGSVDGDSWLAVCFPESNEPTPMSLWHCDPKISIWAFYNGSLWDQLLGCLTVVARMWLGSVDGDSWLAVCFPESNEPTPMSLWHCDPKISIWAFYNGSLWDQLLGCLTVVARVWLGSVDGDSWLDVCCPESNEPTPMFLWHCDPKISIWAFYNGSLWDQLLGCLTVVARVWLGSVDGDSWLDVCCPESNEPTPMSLWHCDPKISIWAFYNGSLWDQLLGCSRWLLGRG